MTRDWMEEVDCWALDIHPIENMVYRTPDGGFAEECRRGENAFDLRRLEAGHR